jgi:hypothetical protein
LGISGFSHQHVDMRENHVPVQIGRASCRERV